MRRLQQPERVRVRIPTKGPDSAGMFGFGAVILAAVIYVAYSVYADASAVGL